MNAKREWLAKMEAERQRDARAWSEYDSAAEWCAARGIAGNAGDPLPESLSADAAALIDEDPEAFADRVRQMAYARAMGKEPTK